MKNIGDGFIFYLTLLTLAFVSLTCEEEVPDPNQIDFPDRNVSYGKHVEPLFFRSCVFSGCHDAEAKYAGGLSLETYNDAVFSRPGVIISQNPDDSRLIRRVEGRDGLERMPPSWSNVSRLNDNQIRGLRQWIIEGAQNN